MTQQYNDFLTEQATHAQAQILYWTAQALHALKRGYYKNTLNGLQNAIGHMYDLERYTAPIPDRPDLESPEFMQAHQQAIKTAAERAEKERKDGTDDLDPERIETVADLRARIKAGDPTARDLINDLVSDCPTQATAWIQREDLDRWTADQGYTAEQLDDIWHDLQQADILDTDGEIRNICEQYEPAGE